MSNSIFARIDKIDYEIESGSIDYSLDSANTFSINILASEFTNWRNINGIDVEIFSNDTSLISGFVDKQPQLSIKEGTPLIVNIKCLDELGRLTLERAKSTAHYQDQQVVGIINDLLTSVAANWTVSIVNMVDPLIETTVDLRNKETLFSQISETIRSVPDLHMRYGGIDGVTGEYVIEIGNFGDVTERAIQHLNLFDLNLQFNTNQVLLTVESFGDLTSTTRINLNDALSDVRTTAHPDYAQFPISQDPITLVWICTNTAISYGSNIRKSLNVVKTKNDIAPTAAEIAEAGYALWLKTVRIMKSSIETETYSGTFLSPNIPKIGDKMRVKSTVKEPVYDAFSGKIVEDIETFSVDDDFRIIDLKHKLGEKYILQDVLSFNFEQNYNAFDFSVTSNDEAELNDPELELYERLERFDAFDNVSGSIEVFPVQVTSLTYSSANPADCNAAGGVPPPSDGKDYTIASPVYPGWATNVTTWYTIDRGAQVKTVTPPAVLGNSWTACIQDSGGVWPPAVGAPITVKVYWLFT